MSTFSITAPRFTEEADHLEQESLSLAERADIQNDVFGTGVDDSAVAETPALRIQAVVEMEEELADIPAHDKREYAQAMTVCPELFSEGAEADPLRFLRCEDFNAKNAAKRMVAFWAMRSKICGGAAFLPLVATGHGALNAEAIALLNEGYGVRLRDDSEGRTVLFIDRARFRHSGEFRNAMLQLVLYMFCVILEEEESSQKKGFVLVVNGKNIKPAKYDRKLSRFSLALLRDCLPIKFRAVHVCLPQLKPPFHFIIPVVKFMAGKHIRRRMVLHSGSENEIIMRLITYGLSRSILPSEVGGDYHWEAFHAEWVANRLLVERRREEALERR